MLYKLPERDELPLDKITFSVLSTNNPDHRTLPRVVDLAIVIVKGEKVQRRIEKCLKPPPLIPPRGRLTAEVSSLTSFIDGSVIASFDLVRDLRNLNHILTSHGFDMLGNESISIRRLSRFLLPELGGNTVGPLVEHFKLRMLSLEKATHTADVVADIFIELLRLVDERDIPTLGALKKSISESREVVDWGKYAFDRNNLQYFPPCPGVYIMRDRKGEVIYIGKAISLRERVVTYFTGREEERVRGLRERVFDIDYIRTGTGLAALLTEAELITTYSPPFNTALTTQQRKAPAKRSRKSSAGNESPPGSGTLIFLPAEKKDEIDLICMIRRRPLWRRILKTDMSNFPILIEDFLSFLTPRLDEELSPDEEYLATLVESWLQRNKDTVNLIEIEIDEDYSSLERKIRPLVESGDWLAEKIVYRL